MANKGIVLDIKYKPLEKQSLFHLSGAKYRLYIGAWRAGKTYAGCQEAFKQSYLYPKNCGVIFRKDFTDLRDTTMKTLFEVIPPEFISDYNKTEHRVVLRNGSEIYFKHLKEGVKLGSLNLGWFFIDEAEEVDEQVFTYLQGRLSLNTVGRQCGWLVSNPPNVDHWIYQKFEQSNDPDFATFHASTYENKSNLPNNYISSLENLPPSWRKKYLEGDYGFTPDGKPFYEGYVEAIHRQDIPYDPQIPLTCGWDFGKRHPAFVATQIHPDGRWNILYELMGSYVTIDKFVDNQVFPELNKRFPGATAIHYGDPACNQVSDKSEQTTYQILLSKGILIHSKPSEYRLRKEIIEKKINTIQNGLPLLIVNPQCKTINDGFMGGYHYPDYDPSKSFTEKFEQPFHDDFYSHLINSLEYIAIHTFSPITKKQDRFIPRRKFVSADNI